MLRSVGRVQVGGTCNRDRDRNRDNRNRNRNRNHNRNRSSGVLERARSFKDDYGDGGSDFLTTVGARRRLGSGEDLGSTGGGGRANWPSFGNNGDGNGGGDNGGGGGGGDNGGGGSSQQRQQRGGGGGEYYHPYGQGGGGGGQGQGQGQRGPAAADAPYSPGQGGYEQQRGQRQSLIGCISRSGHESGDKANITVLKGFLTKVG